MTVLHITSDRPLAGKTALAASLLGYWTRFEKRVGYFKPFSQDPAQDSDVAFIHKSILYSDEAINTTFPLAKLRESLQTGSLPVEVAEGIKGALESIAGDKDLVIVEGPSLSTPQGDSSFISSQLLELLNARAIVVVHYTPALDAQQVAKLAQPFGQRLLGVIINSVLRYRGRDVQTKLIPAIEASGVKVLGAIPEDRSMLAVTVGQVVEHLKARWIVGEEKSDDLIEHFLIGGNIMDWGVTYFGRVGNKGVIVRGDRPDIQLATLSTPTSCLILTGGHEPIQYVYHEAEQQEVPLIVVQSDTISTTDALGSVFDHGSVHHRKKLERFQELLRQHADIEGIQAGLKD